MFADVSPGDIPSQNAAVTSAQSQLAATGSQAGLFTITIESANTSVSAGFQNSPDIPRSLRTLVQDNNLATWNAWSNEYWPAEYLIDAKGHVRSAKFGEGDYGKSEHEIRELLAAAGAKGLGGDAKPSRTYDPTI